MAAHFDFTIPTFEIQLVDELKQPAKNWLKFSLHEMKVTNRIRKSDSTMNLSMNAFSIIDQTLAFNQEIFSQKCL